MKIIFAAHGCDDCTSWVRDPKTVARINRLIAEAARAPSAGTGKPERLSGDLSGCWSRRIDQEHRWSTRSRETTG